jgi:hypothetical protein
MRPGGGVEIQLMICLARARSILVESRLPTALAAYP